MLQEQLDSRRYAFERANRNQAFKTDIEIRARPNPAHSVNTLQHWMQLRSQSPSVRIAAGAPYDSQIH